MVRSRLGGVSCRMAGSLRRTGDSRVAGLRHGDDSAVASIAGVG